MSNHLGNDILLFDNDLVIGANQDFMTSSDFEANNSSTSRFDGYYNIIFSVFNRMNTIKGEIPWHSSYGSILPLIVSKANNKSAADKVREEFTNILKEDPRIKEVKSVDIEQNGNQMSVRADLLLSGKSESSIFIFPNFFIE